MPKSLQLPTLLSPPEVSELLGIPLQTLAAWRKRADHGGLPYLKIGRHVRYEPAAVQRFIADRRVA